jgi:hypothetical protein
MRQRVMDLFNSFLFDDFFDNYWSNEWKRKLVSLKSLS